MSHFFEDVGNVVSAPFKGTYGLLTNNPKYNSIGDIYNQTVGDSNSLADVFQNEGLNKASKIFSLPSWDELGKPGQAFSTFIDRQNSVLPADWRQYAQPVESALLNFVPGAGPLLSAGFNTAYQGGKQQEQNKGFDWGDFGKNAAVNFGTAAIQTGANSLLNNAKAASSLKAFEGTPSSVASAGNSAINSNVLGAFNPASVAGASAATPGFAATSAANLASNSANALGSIGANIPQAVSAGSSALNAFNTPFNSSTQSDSLLPKAQQVQASGLGDKVYNNAIQPVANVAKEDIVSSLAPTANRPISSSLDGFGSTGGGNSSLQYGDLLNAFGGDEINKPNPNGNRIDSTALDQIGQRLGANVYLQQNQARDAALPAGQYQAAQNTPYANRLSEIGKGADQEFSDLLDQVGNANKYYSIIDSNPGITTDQLDQYLNDPSSGLIGNFSVPQEQSSFFQGLRPLNPTNSSLLH